MAFVAGACGSGSVVRAEWTGIGFVLEPGAQEGGDVPA